MDAWLRLFRCVPRQSAYTHGSGLCISAVGDSHDAWKYAALEHQPWLLFNLNEDPFELVNLAHNTAFKTERKRLQDRLERWINETGDTFALPELDPFK
jgi:arylsulfatase A-like enzyme